MYHAIWGLQAIAVHLSTCLISNFCQMNMLNETLENTSRFIYIPKRHILDDLLRRADWNLVDKIYHKRRWHHHLHNHYQFSSIKMASFADGIFKFISWNCVFLSILIQMSLFVSIYEIYLVGNASSNGWASNRHRAILWNINEPAP